MRLSPVLGSLVLALSAGCIGAEDASIDGEADRYIVDGKADTGGIQEGTPEAAAVLFVASTFSRADLVGDVGLAAKAADNVMAYRQGDDGAAATSDDETFGTLAELDAVPFVGPIAFGKLLAYAQANDIVGDVPVAGPVEDPFDPASCQGPNLSQEAANTLWSTQRGRLGTYQLQLRSRTCTGADASTCGAWAPYPLSNLNWRFDATGLIELRKYGNEVRLALEARTCADGNRTLVVGTTCDGVGYDLFCYAYDYPDDCGTYSHPSPDLNVGSEQLAFSGRLTENCVRLTDQTTEYLGGGKRIEFETVLLDRF